MERSLERNSADGEYAGTEEFVARESAREVVGELGLDSVDAGLVAGLVLEGEAHAVDVGREEGAGRKAADLFVRVFSKRDGEHHRRAGDSLAGVVFRKDAARDHVLHLGVARVAHKTGAHAGPPREHNLGGLCVLDRLVAVDVDFERVAAAVDQVFRVVGRLVEEDDCVFRAARLELREVAARLALFAVGEVQRVALFCCRRAVLLVSARDCAVHLRRRHHH